MEEERKKSIYRSRAPSRGLLLSVDDALEPFMSVIQVFINRFWLLLTGYLLDYFGANYSEYATAEKASTLAGSLDPATRIFYRTPELPVYKRRRPARSVRRQNFLKNKHVLCYGLDCINFTTFYEVQRWVSSCNSCVTRGLICEYAKEGRFRGPNKP